MGYLPFFLAWMPFHFWHGSPFHSFWHGCPSIFGMGRHSILSGMDALPFLAWVAIFRRAIDVHVLAMQIDRGECHRKICSQLLATALLHPPVVSDMWFVVPREHVVPPGIPHVLSRTQCGNDGSYSRCIRACTTVTQYTNAEAGTCRMSVTTRRCRST